MQELYRDEDTVAYRLHCTDGNHEHVLDVEIDSEEDKVLLVAFQEHICPRTKKLLWRLNAAFRILLGWDLCLREVVIGREEILELVKILNGTSV